MGFWTYRAYRPPSKWYRRNRAFQITYWPKWLAQRLCPHTVAQEEAKFYGGLELIICPDCQKLIEVQK